MEFASFSEEYKTKLPLPLTVSFCAPYDMEFERVVCFKAERPFGEPMFISSVKCYCKHMKGKVC